MQVNRIALITVCGFALCAKPAGQPQVSFDALSLVKALAGNCEQARQYYFEGKLLLEGQRGSAPAKVLAQTRLTLGVSRPGKYLLRLAPAKRNAYSLISNGQKSWVYVPKLKQYTEEGVATPVDDGAGEVSTGGADEERDLAEHFSRLVVPTLARLSGAAQAAEVTGWETVKYENQRQRWARIRVTSGKDGRNGQSLTELTLNPGTLSLGRMVWTNVTYSNDEKISLRMTVDFNTFRVGRSLPDEIFNFKPPRKAKLVDAVPVPGQTGSFLLNRPAPDFEMKTIEGERVRLADFRGRPVLLNFWASTSAPSERELPGLAALYQEYKNKGLVVLGVNNEGRPIARYFSRKAALGFPTIDDTTLRARHLYRVRFVPTSFLIDRDGKVVRFLSGAHDLNSLRAALKAAGL